MVDRDQTTSPTDLQDCRMALTMSKQQVWSALAAIEQEPAPRMQGVDADTGQGGERLIDRTPLRRHDHIGNSPPHPSPWRPRMRDFPLVAAIRIAAALFCLALSSPLHAQSPPVPNSREAREAEQRAAWQAAGAVAIRGPADV